MSFKINLKKTFYFSLTIYLLVQVGYVCFSNLPFTSDSLRYYNLAKECIEKGVMYPGVHNHFDSYISAPVYINYLIIILKIFTSPFAILWGNVILNILQLFLLMKITVVLYKNSSLKYIVGLMYIFYLTNLGLILLNFTELLFNVFLLCALFLITKKKVRYHLLAGLLVALAAGVRPTGTIMAIAALCLFVIVYIRTKLVKKELIYLVISFAATTVLFGFVYKYSSGEYLFFQNTDAVNILMGANNNSNGTYYDKIFEKGNAGYLENENSLPHYVKSEFWRNTAISWMKANPVKWVSLIPLKLFHTYAYDDWSISTLTGTTDWNIYKIAKTIFKEHDYTSLAKDKNMFFIIFFLIIMIYHHIYYFVLLFILIWQIVYYYRNKSKITIYHQLVWLFTVIGNLAIILAVGLSRYKYSFIILMLITAAPIVQDFLQKRNKVDN